MTIGKITQDRNTCKEKLNSKLKDLEKTKKSIEEQKASIKKSEKMLADEKKKAAKIEDETRTLNEKQIKSNLITVLNYIIQIDHHVKQKKIEEDLISILETLQKKLQIEKIRFGQQDENQKNELEISY